MKQHTILVDPQTQQLFERLQPALSLTLPGTEAQMQMVPAARHDQIFRQKHQTPVHSSILIVMYFKGQKVHVLFIRRPEYPGVHSGQIAFPGGRREPEDADNLATGLRETEEETGIQRETLQIAGALTPLYIPPSNYLVFPFVAVAPPDPRFIPDPTEVASIVEIPLENLLNPDSIRLMPPAREFSFLEVPAYVIGETVIWGATAMITAELLAVISRVKTLQQTEKTGITE
ncbi:MAG TPA: CoA pyrophosphatase [Bacteroidales bacterium]|nr:CoA pyrophosphatase [Bacteroidales bacterium]HRZ49624.1 CoA pyrophosphatase [Bacteroidales bacterium]